MDTTRTTEAGRGPIYAIRDQQLLVEGRPQNVEHRIVALCLDRHGLPSRGGYRRIPARVGMHILRIATLIEGIRAMGRNESTDKPLVKARVEKEGRA